MLSWYEYGNSFMISMDKLKIVICYGVLLSLLFLTLEVASLPIQLSLRSRSSLEKRLL